MVRTARQAKVREGFEKILMPGDPEAIQRRQRSEKGVDVDETSWQEILDAAETAGVAKSDVQAILEG